MRAASLLTLFQRECRPKDVLAVLKGYMREWVSENQALLWVQFWRQGQPTSRKISLGCLGSIELAWRVVNAAEPRKAIRSPKATEALSVYASPIGDAENAGQADSINQQVEAKRP